MEELYDRNIELNYSVGDTEEMHREELQDRKTVRNTKIWKREETAGKGDMEEHQDKER